MPRPCLKRARARAAAVLPTGLDDLGEAPQVLGDRQRVLHRRACRSSPPRRATRPPGCRPRRTGRARAIKRLMSGACAPRSANTGVAWSDSAPRRTHRRAQLAQEARAAARCRPRGRRCARRSPRPPLLECSMKDGDVLALARQRRERGVGVAREVGAATLFCEARISRTLSTSLSAGSARRTTSLSSSPRPASAGAELGRGSATAAPGRAGA